MDKGIFTLICSIVTICAIAVVGVTLHNDMRDMKAVYLKGQMIVASPTPTPTPTLITATPSASIKQGAVLPVKPSATGTGILRK